MANGGSSQLADSRMRRHANRNSYHQTSPRLSKSDMPFATFPTPVSKNVLKCPEFWKEICEGQL